MLALTSPPAQSADCWTRFAQTRDPHLRQELILQYVPLVRYVIGRMALHLPAILDSEDILGYGMIGLIEAVDRFDPAHGVKFETYAIQRIRGSILDALRSLNLLSRSASKRARELEQAYLALQQEHGRMPTEEEVCRYLHLSPEEYARALQDASHAMVSLDAATVLQGDEDEPMSLLAVLPDETSPDPEQEAMRSELRRALIQAIEHLPERDRLVISLYYYEDLTLKEISAVLEVSESRVSQLHTAAMLKLRAALRAARLMQPVGAPQ
jgi:RNA polymerase sigma factor for flagellar operon FliA